VKNSEIAITRILEAKLASPKLETVLRLLLKDYHNDIYVEPQTQLVHIYVRESKESYTIPCTLGYLIEEAARIAKYLGMTPEEFQSVGQMLDELG
jgi:hypothetical protein